jgi:hypothetical protein
LIYEGLKVRERDHSVKKHKWMRYVTLTLEPTQPDCIKMSNNPASNVRHESITSLVTLQ